MHALRKALLTLVLIVLPLSASHGAQTAAGSTVATLHSTLLDVMKRSQELGYKGRYEALNPVISDSFDFAAIARVVLGRYWSELKPEQQQAFVEAFTRLSVATYASRFDSFSGESFRPVDATEQGDENVTVKTELVKADGGTVRLDYVLRPGEGERWRILNVVADGISDLSLKRADYTSIMKNEGYEALITKLNERVGRYASEPETDGQ